MNFRIAGTFNDSLGRLNGDEQKAVKQTVYDLQVNPANPGIQMHRLERSKDKNFWSARVSGDLRIIVHRTEGNFLLCYVDHHDPAYNWANRRKLETHPKTGAAQIVEVRETVQEIVVPQYVEGGPEVRPKRKILAHIKKEELLSYGVPEEWLEDVLDADEDSILQVADHLPEEAAEAVLELATGGRPNLPEKPEMDIDPFEHPDAQRRFRIMEDRETLEQALAFPWDKWTIFLHPTQRELVERSCNGPARVSGTAGTGKTIVAIHRAAYVAKQAPGSRVLLTTFSPALADNLRSKLRRLIHNQPMLGERIEVQSLDELATSLYQKNFGKVKIPKERTIMQYLKEAAEIQPVAFLSQSFLFEEWKEIVDAWQLKTWEAYREVARLGRKTRLPEAKREQLWGIFELVWKRLDDTKSMTLASLYQKLADHYGSEGKSPYDAIVVDEAQDLSVVQLRMLAAMGKFKEGSLFFAGDLGQRIFQQPFSWKALGVDIRGRSRTLKINYRTSHQIRRQADRLLDPEISDVDGNTERRGDAISVFNGPVPIILEASNEEDEIGKVGEWLSRCTATGVQPSEIGVFVRSEDQLRRATLAVEASGLEPQVLVDSYRSQSGKVVVCPMHLAKGLEFRSVVVMACDDEVIPLQSRIESIGDNADLEEVYNTERHLLYVACTRARDHLMVSGVEPISEFVEDMR